MRKIVFNIVFISCCFSVMALHAQQSEKMYLSGTGNDHTVNWEFYCTAGRNAGKWTTIAVPSCWELQGFGKYDYGFAKDSVRGKEKGLYRYRFSVPAAWKNRQVNIHFEGSMTDTEIKINGKQAGDIHQGAFYAFQYDITNLLNYGPENLLEVTVAKHSANASVNEAERKADFWIFGGIFRPVFLEAMPAQYIAHTAIDAKADGLFNTTVDLSISRPSEVSVEIRSLKGNRLGNAVRKTVAAGQTKLQLQSAFTGVRAWSSEFPDLYEAEFSLI